MRVVGFVIRPLSRTATDCVVQEFVLEGEGDGVVAALTVLGLRRTFAENIDGTRLSFLAA